MILRPFTRSPAFAVARGPADMTPLRNNLEALAIAAARRNNASLWYVPDSLSGLYQDAAGTQPATVGSPIGLFTDQQHGAANAALGASALGYAMSQATTANKPSVVQLANGRKAYRFNGTSSVLASLGLNTASTGTLVVAATLSGTSGWKAFCGSGAQTGAGVRLTTQGAGSNPLLNNGPSQGVAALGFIPVVSAPFVLSGAWSAANFPRVFVNGVLANSLSIGPGPSVSTGGFAIGSFQPGGGDLFQGDMSLVCFCPTDMPPADRATIERFGAYLSGATYAA